MFPHVASVQPLEGHQLRLGFDDGTAGVVDFAPRIRFEGVFAPFADPAWFRQVRIDEESRTLVWPNGVDLDPVVLYATAHGLTPEAVLALPEPATGPASARLDVSDSVFSSEAQDGPGGRMPEISRFFGIVIRMSFSDHAPPHFHAHYGRHVVSIAIDSLGVVEGSLPPRALGMVLEWTLLPKTLLQADWELARAGKSLHRIPPLQ